MVKLPVSGAVGFQTDNINSCMGEWWKWIYKFIYIYMLIFSTDNGAFISIWRPIYTRLIAIVWLCILPPVSGGIFRHDFFDLPCLSFPFVSFSSS